MRSTELTKKVEACEARLAKLEEPAPTPSPLAAMLADHDKRLKDLDDHYNTAKCCLLDVQRMETQNRTVLAQYGAFRVAVKSIMVGLTNALGAIDVSVGYTQSEIYRMTADEYRIKVLTPLGMANRFNSWR
jgi:hypothetical protein